MMGHRAASAEPRPRIGSYTRLVLSLRERSAERRPLLGAWTFLREPFAAEVAAQAGYDYVCVDAQHGLHDDASIAAQLTAIRAGGDALPLVRVLANEAGAIGRVLDAGALGVIVPMVNSAADAAAVVAAARYAPVGARSFGPIGAMTRYGADYAGRVDELVAVIPMVETVEAVADVEAIAATPGVDALYVGPSDLALTMGLAPGADQDDAEFDRALAAVVAACRAHDVIPAIHTEPELVAKRVAQGFTMMTIGFDWGSMVAGFRQALASGRAAADGTTAGDATTDERA